jgi:hypothetical protein
MDVIKLLAEGMVGERVTLFRLVGIRHRGLLLALNCGAAIGMRTLSGNRCSGV